MSSELDRRLRDAMRADDAPEVSAGAAVDAPEGPLPARSPALRDQDLARVLELAQERADASALAMVVSKEPVAPPGWLRRALAVLRAPSSVGAPFAHASHLAPAAAVVHHDVAAGAPAYLNLHSRGPDLVYALVLSESSTGEIGISGSGAALLAPGLSAAVTLGELHTGVHVYMVVTVRTRPPAAAEVLHGSLDDLIALGLVSVAQLVLTATA